MRQKKTGHYLSDWPKYAKYLMKIFEIDLIAVKTLWNRGALTNFIASLLGCAKNDCSNHSPSVKAVFSPSKWILFFI